MDIYFRVEGENVKMYRGEASLGDLGTLLPRSDEQFLRLLYRAVEIGKQEKAAEIRSALGA